MNKTQDNLILLNCIFITALVISNVIAVKVISVFGLITSAATFCYPMTFLITDIIGEIWGRQEANKTVSRGIICQVISTILIFSGILLPPADFMKDYQEIYKQVLGGSSRLVFASLVAFSISQLNDIFFFHKISNLTKGNKKWLRNNISTFISQTLDTSIFVTIGFWGIVPNILVMIIGQLIIKWAWALFDTPFFYYFTRGWKATSE